MSQATVEIKIFHAEPEHLEVIAPLFNAYRIFYEQPSDPEGAREFIRTRLENEDSVIFWAVAAAEGKVIGMGFIQLYPTLSSLSLGRLWLLNDIYVSPEARRLGVAKALMQRARQLATESGAVGLVLNTAVDNLPAQQLYESLGYQQKEKFVTYSLNL
ncbi:MAG TPA: GNAT family N-acetyltransferase [Anaerolineae bacterium]|nr:GNAT family N-acetyltransferase [Anaerolineae bacterium]